MVESVSTPGVFAPNGSIGFGKAFSIVLGLTSTVANTELCINEGYGKHQNDEGE